MAQAAEKLAPEAPDATKSPAVRLRDVTVRFTYNEPATLFLTAVANADGSDRSYAMFLPAHYLKKFHPAYTPKEELDRQAQAVSFKTWTMPTTNGTAATPKRVVSFMRSLLARRRRALARQRCH